MWGVFPRRFTGAVVWSGRAQSSSENVNAPRRLRGAVGIGMLRAMQKAIFLVLLVAVAGAGCAYGEVRQVVRTQFAADVNCGEVKVEKKGFAYFPEDSKDDRFKVTGCGVERTYTCPRDAGLVCYDDAVCTWVAGDPDAPKAAVAAPEVEDPFADGAKVE